MHTSRVQVAEALLKEKHLDVQIKLLYANQTENDILIREKIEKLAEDPRFDVWCAEIRAEIRAPGRSA